MTDSSRAVSPYIQLNNQACDLLYSTQYHLAFGVLKDAMALLKGQISQLGQLCTLPKLIPKCPKVSMARSRFTLHQHTLRNDRTSCKYWIYTRPLWIETKTPTDEAFLVFILTFNLSLACHMLAIEHGQRGEKSESQQSFQMAKQLYSLPMKLVQTIQTDLRNDVFHPYVFAGILSNVSHVHASLQEEQPALAYRTHLMKALFFFVDRQFNDSMETIQCFQCLMENVDDLVLDVGKSAAAA